MARMGEDDSRESKKEDYWEDIEIRKEDTRKRKRC